MMRALLRPPPQPPRFDFLLGQPPPPPATPPRFYFVPLFYSGRPASKESVPNPFFTWASLLQTNPLQTHDAGIVLANGGGCAPPNPPAFLFPRAGLLQTNPFQTHDAGIVLANGGGIASKPTMRALSWQMGGAAPPPTPPLVFFTRASLLQTNRFQTVNPVVTTIKPLVSLDVPLVSDATLSGL